MQVSKSWYLPTGILCMLNVQYKVLYLKCISVGILRMVSISIYQIYISRVYTQIEKVRDFIVFRTCFKYTFMHEIFSVAANWLLCIQPHLQQTRMAFIFYNDTEFSVKVGSLKWVIIPPMSKVQPAGSRSTGKQPIIFPTTLNFICPQPLSTDYTINTPQMRRANNWPGQINASK